jgi:hypothetical protein
MTCSLIVPSSLPTKSRKLLMELVAGAGFEPATFGL